MKSPWIPLLSLILAGCGSHQGSLSGTVRFQGKTVMQGSVVALPSDRVPRTTPLQNGRYEFTALPTGAVELAVLSPHPAQAKVLARKKEDAPRPSEVAGWFALPDRFGNLEESGLKTSVGSGVNVFDIELK